MRAIWDTHLKAGFTCNCSTNNHPPQLHSADDFDCCVTARQDCPDTGVHRSSGRRGSGGGGVVEEGIGEGGATSENTTSGDPDRSCRSVHREGQEASGRGGRENPQGGRVAPARRRRSRTSKQLRTPRYKWSVSESNRLNQSHSPQS